MLGIFEIIKVIFLGIVEGITEWLPISSTGHMILFDEFVKLNVSDEFKEMFFVVIQFGAIIAVIIRFWDKLWPFAKSKQGQGIVVKKPIINLWLHMLVSCVPAIIVGLPLDDFIDEYLYNPYVVAAALIFFGVAFIWVENRNAARKPQITRVSQIDYKTALIIGLFQLIAALFPGTSRSGATIVGASARSFKAGCRAVHVLSRGSRYGGCKLLKARQIRPALLCNRVLLSYARYARSVCGIVGCNQLPDELHQEARLQILRLVQNHTRRICASVFRN